MGLNRSWKISVVAVAASLGLMSFSTARGWVAPVVSNPGVVQIDSPQKFSAIYAISDVHGMYVPLLKLLAAARISDASGRWLAGKSLLVVVGDSIDKGPESIEVIDFWMQLSAEASRQGGAVLHLLGNHEAEFLADPTADHKAKMLLAELKARHMTIADLVDPSAPRGAFLRSQPVAARIGRWLFTHSGYVADSSFSQFAVHAASAMKVQNYNVPFLIGSQSALETKDWWRSDGVIRARYESWLSANGLSGVVFGHQPEAMNVSGSPAISQDGRLIKVDNGMAPEAGAHHGSVIVFSHPEQLAGPTEPAVEYISADNPVARPLPLEIPESLSDSGKK